MTEKCIATGKAVFSNQEEAQASIGKIKSAFKYLKEKGKARHRLGKPAQKRSYHCAHCNGYHLTSWCYYSIKAQKEKKARQRFFIEHILFLVR